MIVICIIVLLAACVILAAAIAASFRVYKKKISRMIKDGESGSQPSGPPYKPLIITAVILLILTAVTGYFTGYKTAYDRMENGALATDDAVGYTQTFYGKITGITGSLEAGNTIRVSGLDVNDINFRGDFEISVSGETILQWRGTSIEFSQLENGDTISITFSGQVKETSPAMIDQVDRIQLLDDEI